MLKNIRLFILILFLHVPLFSNDAVVFMYHRFGETTYPSTNITLEQFGYQLDYLQKNNYNVWHLSKIVNYLQSNRKLPPKTVALTIDDAYISVYTKAYPMLKAKRFPFTVMVSTNPVDNKSKFYMSWEMMREMQRHGAEFANHSSSHSFLLQKKDELQTVWEERFTNEVTNAQIRLQEELGSYTNENPKLFSYPFGEYDIKTKKMLRELGYFGITQTSGSMSKDSDFMEIRRFPMAEAFATPDGFITKLNTLVMPIKFLYPNHTIVNYINPPRLHVQLEEPLKNLQCYLSNGEAIKVEWISDKEFETSSNAPINPPREKYTCTAPAEDGKWYWYSHLWILK